MPYKYKFILYLDLQKQQQKQRKVIIHLQNLSNDLFTILYISRNSDQTKSLQHKK